MAEARQKEMKVSITVVATKTFIAGLEPSTGVAIIQIHHSDERANGVRDKPSR